ncbi:15-hydroxyprostaglandin dehydrogenase [Fusarium acutatum]|uniref:15-hydroxyprostaglandin dehydrogenase n=2 Tax=Fusarium TaxID=5506 RepID=A0A9P5DKE5_9HYPO|nr:15-hydroxyprostaglandin dehydrogenase [Fusarium beomiforme]KAF4413715.1 15-hydroxyprostaglandin dehydrogenase [Fusarium acutatum]
MSLIELNPLCLPSLKGKVVLITGGAEGIGREAAILFHGHGAKVVVGDVKAEAGASLALKLGSNFLFLECDVTSYQQQLDLFQSAKDTFGPVNIAISNAGVNGIMDPMIDLSAIETEPKFPEIDVNLRGALFTARLALHQMQANGGGNIILVSSIGGFKEMERITPYVASKHGVIGILRGMRLTSIKQNVQINAICPWMTKTNMAAGFAEGWQKLGLPANEPEDVAKAMLICATANQGSEFRHKGAKTPFHGKMVYVSGGKAYEIEDRIQSLEPFWLGEDNSERLAAGQEYLQSGSFN